MVDRHTLLEGGSTLLKTPAGHPRMFHGTPVENHCCRHLLSGTNLTRKKLQHIGKG